jgi:hypothetical protein
VTSAAPATPTTPATPKAAAPSKKKPSKKKKTKRGAQRIDTGLKPMAEPNLSEILDDEIPY